MQKNPADIQRRRADILKEIRSAGARETTHVIKNFAFLHYLSEATVWRDYELALRQEAEVKELKSA